MYKLLISFLFFSCVNQSLIAMEYPQDDQKRLLQEIMETQNSTLETKKVATYLNLTKKLSSKYKGSVFSIIPELMSNLNSYYYQLLKINSLKAANLAVKIKTCENNYLDYLLSLEKITHLEYKTSLPIELDEKDPQINKLITEYMQLSKEYDDFNKTIVRESSNE